jgi:hypothetical protein
VGIEQKFNFHITEAMANKRDLYIVALDYKDIFGYVLH